MTAHRAPLPPGISVLRTRGPGLSASKGLSVAQMKARQTSKIMELAEALAASGLNGLDDQARALGLCRSTAWTILKAQHKGSGLSANVINKMLRSAQIPLPVRRTLVAYVAEKVAGCYGDNKAQLHRFCARVDGKVLDEARGLIARIHGEVCGHPAGDTVVHFVGSASRAG
jgi:hypothetical protein